MEHSDQVFITPTGKQSAGSHSRVQRRRFGPFTLPRPDRLSHASCTRSLYTIRREFPRWCLSHRCAKSLATPRRITAISVCDTRREATSDGLDRWLVIGAFCIAFASLCLFLVYGAGLGPIGPAARAVRLTRGPRGRASLV
jgi:hypothetical protein